MQAAVVPSSCAECQDIMFPHLLTGLASSYSPSPLPPSHRNNESIAGDGFDHARHRRLAVLAPRLLGDHVGAAPRQLHAACRVKGRDIRLPSRRRAAKDVQRCRPFRAIWEVSTKTSGVWIAGIAARRERHCRFGSFCILLSSEYLYPRELPHACFHLMSKLVDLPIAATVERATAQVLRGMSPMITLRWSDAPYMCVLSEMEHLEHKCGCAIIRLADLPRLTFPSTVLIGSTRGRGNFRARAPARCPRIESLSTEVKRVPAEFPWHARHAATFHI